MKTAQLFLESDAALRSVIERLTPADLAAPVPADWSQAPASTMRDILAYHAYDEAWVPRVLAGEAAAVGNGVDRAATFRFTYGDYPAAEGLVHLTIYRAFQAWQTAKHFGIDFNLSPEIIAGMNKHVVPHAAQWRAFGVFPPPIDPPAGADDETQLLCTLGFWVP